MSEAFRYCTVKEAAVILRCCEATIRTLVRKGTLPAVRMPGQRRILIPVNFLDDRVPKEVVGR
jgi:excisionase family DNA binding protein